MRSIQGPVKKEEIVVYGQPKSGKTTFALSASKHWPEGGKCEDGKEVVLEDVTHLAWDKLALNCLRQTGITVPGVDMRTLGRTKYYDKGMQAIDPIDTFQAVHKALLKEGLPEDGFVIHDTISMFDKLLLHYWARDPAYLANPTGQSQIFYRHILDSHTAYHSMMGELPGTHIFVMHEKYLGEGVKPTKDQKEKARAIKGMSDSSPAMVCYRPLVTGDAYNLYCGDNSFNIPVVKTMKGIKVYPRGSTTHMGNSKYSHYLDAAYEPNLRKLLTAAGSL